MKRSKTIAQRRLSWFGHLARMQHETPAKNDLLHCNVHVSL